MGCNCKTAKKNESIDEIMDDVYKEKKLTMFTKLIISYNFIEFYFFFVTSSVINFLVNDKLEPSIPKWLLKKYSKY